jgi:hypothetical protein
MKSIKDVFLFPFPKVLNFYLIQSILGLINASVRSWIFIWIYLDLFEWIQI